MSNSYKSIRSWLSFYLGKNPIIEKTKSDFRNYIPEPYKSVVIISADFELAWAWRFDKHNDNPLKNGETLAKRERDNIPKILDLCEQYSIPITWGTVGHLFLDHCDLDKSLPHSELTRLPYFENKWWKYDKEDWFSFDPCSCLEKAPNWYAPDLVQKIILSKVKHEIGSHTFSHISCSDNVCTPEVLKNELEASQKAADIHSIKLNSFIFPGHTMGNYQTIKDAGFSSIRTNFNNVLGYPIKQSNGLWEHKTTMELNFNKLLSVKQNVNRFRSIINKSINNHQVCNFWFHPSFDKKNIEIIFPIVFNILKSKSDEIWVTTMEDYTTWLLDQK